MGAPVGNANGAKQRKFYDAMMRACAAEDYAQLRRIADNTLKLAEAGESWAVQMVRDTLDGKPAQNVALTGEDGGPVKLTWAER